MKTGSGNFFILFCFIFICSFSPHLIFARNAGLFPDKINGHVFLKGTSKPISGVSVFYAGDYKTGTITDSGGAFAIKRSAVSDTLVFTYMGMETIRLYIIGKSLLTVYMEEMSESMPKVVVTGYSNINGETFTGDVTKISRNDLLKVSQSNLFKAIEVFDPTFKITENITRGSDPNTVPSFSIRGRSGLGISELERQNLSTDITRENLTGNPNLPIFIMDGFEVDAEKVYDMDINRIHSINILKDAVATAMYGSRAANGVVVIETRAPGKGKLRISYVSNFELETPDLSSYNLMNASEKLEAEKLYGLYDNSESGVDPYTNEYYRRYNNILEGVNTYWLSKGLRNSFNQSHSIYIDAGEKDVRCGLEFRFKKNDGVMKSSYRNIVGAGFYVDYRFKNFQIKNKVTFDRTGNGDVPYGSFSDYSHMLPYLRIYDDNGSLLPELETFSTVRNTVNPLYEIQNRNSYNRSSYYDIVDDLMFNWFINVHFKIKSTLAVRLYNSRTEVFVDPMSERYSGTDDKYKGKKTITELLKRTLDGDVMLMYHNTFGENHHLNSTLALNLIQNYGKSCYSEYRGFPGGSLTSVNYAYSIVDKPSYSDNTKRMIGGVLSANYDYRNTYLLDLQGRIDGSSEFGADKRWSAFWAVGAGVNLQNTGLLKNSEAISACKIKFTYGLTGKTNFPLYSAKNMYELISDKWYPTGFGTYLYQLGNDKLKWEKKRTANIGLDMGLFENRFSFKFSLYEENTDDMITDRTIQSSSGFTSYKENMGSVRNRGVELYLRFNLLQADTWNLNIYGNYTRNRNTITRLSKAMRDYNKKVETLFNDYDPDSSTGEKYAKTYTKYYEGASLTSIYGMKSLGISPSDGREIYLNRNGSVTDLWSADQWQVIGDGAPDGSGSFGFNLSYKRLSMFASFIYSYGGDRYNYTLVNYVENADIKYSNVDRRVLSQRWRQPGDLVPLKDVGDRSLTTGATSRFVQKYNYLKFNSMSLNYTFGPGITKKLGISMLRLEFHASDLAEFSSIQREAGLDYPYSRTFSLSLRMSL